MSGSALVEDLVAALREELQQYGEMLARLDDQQATIVGRRGDQLLSSVMAVDQQAASMSEARAVRARVANKLLDTLQLPSDSSLQSALPLLAPAYQPLLQALIQENNQLIIRIQQRSRQNHLLLTRSLESMQKLMQTLLPAPPPARYTGSGGAEVPLQTQVFYVAVG